MDFELKTVANKRILYVMAVDAEYGIHLRGHIAPLMTGVGPVEAAVVLTAALGRWKQPVTSRTSSSRSARQARRRLNRRKSIRPPP